MLHELAHTVQAYCNATHARVAVFEGEGWADPDFLWYLYISETFTPAQVIMRNEMILDNPSIALKLMNTVVHYIRSFGPCYALVDTYIYTGRPIIECVPADWWLRQ